MLKFFQIILFLNFMTFSVTNASAASSTKYETAIVAGGCFWGMEELLRDVTGIVKTEVGYIGGEIPNPTYELISSGLTNYAEAVEITFDPQKISYEKLLKFFFTIHDPTEINRQENDVGTQYRSAIFYQNDEQKKIAQSVIAQANKSGVFKKPVTTTLEKAEKFYRAEDYHQDYLQKNPYGYTCHHIHNEWKF
jgi:methionine-S-sulfoxide reductase